MLTLQTLSEHINSTLVRKIYWLKRSWATARSCQQLQVEVSTVAHKMAMTIAFVLFKSIWNMDYTLYFSNSGNNFF